MDSSRELVKKTLLFDHPERIPRNLWLLPATTKRYPEYLKRIETDFPSDIIFTPMRDWILPWSKGDPYKKGIWVDPWGSEWLNVQDGVIGQVHRAAVKDWSDLDTLKVPYPVIGQDNADSEEMK